MCTPPAPEDKASGRASGVGAGSSEPMNSRRRRSASSGLAGKTQLWVLPGGAIEPEEVPADAALREAWEETALHVRLERRPAASPHFRAPTWRPPGAGSGASAFPDASQ